MANTDTYFILEARLNYIRHFFLSYSEDEGCCVLSCSRMVARIVSRHSINSLLRGDLRTRNFGESQEHLRVLIDHVRDWTQTAEHRKTKHLNDSVRFMPWQPYRNTITEFSLRKLPRDSPARRWISCRVRSSFAAFRFFSQLWLDDL